MQKDLRFADYFLFTQYSLNTFESCPLKFKKRYLENLKWDSFPDESIRKRIERGNDFHLLAYRYFMGIPTGLDALTEDSADLKVWMNYLEENFRRLPFRSYLPEYKLRMVTPTLKLEANFDLVIVEDERVEIWDWKTHGGVRSQNLSVIGNRLRNSLQTMVYLFVLAEQLPLVTGRPLPCGQISMHYWQPDKPHIIAEVNYSDVLHESFKLALGEKIKRILEYDYSGFDKSLYIKHCRFCEFNWFCNNEKLDFKAMQEDEDFMEGLEWDMIEEKF